jgi:hypothetical protein
LAINKKFNSWGTHLPVIAKILSQTKGSVLELGPGLYSTPIISQMLAGSGRPYFGVDTDPVWVEEILRNKWLADPSHVVRRVSSYREDIIWDSDDPIGMGNRNRWNVVFLDCFPDEIRYGLLKDMKDGKLLATIIICHDTSPNMDKRMGLRPLLGTFKHRFTYDRLMPWTDVVSDTIDVRELMGV